MNIDDSLRWYNINLPPKPIQAYQPILILRPRRKTLGPPTSQSITKLGKSGYRGLGPFLMNVYDLASVLLSCNWYQSLNREACVSEW